jgi:hypothetical protein
LSDRPAPYPADTRAKGWRFELDYEKIDQSDTWDLAAEVPMAQHALLMMWMVSWRQEPCGSMPNDEAVIRSKCRIPASMWEQFREIMLRGWWLADDGRLYHDTVTMRVLEMIEYRRKEAARRAGNRAKTQDDSSCHTDVPRDTGVTNVGQPRESTVSPDTGTGTSSSPTSKKKPRAKPAGPPCPDGVTEQVWSDWLELRAKKRAPVTQTVVDGLHVEAGKAGMSVEAFLRIWCQRGTHGLQADWLKPHERQGAPPAETPYARQMRERAQVLGPGVAAKPPGQPINIIVLQSDGNDQQKRIA